MLVYELLLRVGAAPPSSILAPRFTSFLQGNLRTMLASRHFLFIILRPRGIKQLFLSYALILVALLLAIVLYERGPPVI